MQLHRLISYSLMTAGALASAKAILKRWQWEENNVITAIMLDWDDVQAVATRAAGLADRTNGSGSPVEALLLIYKENGATHLSIPELTLDRLLARGELSVTQGNDPGRVYLQAQTSELAELVTTELQARLPQLQAQLTTAEKPLISFIGDLPAVAEVSLGFNPAHFDLAGRVGLAPVPRPVGFSWVQPEMIDRTLDQAAALGAKLIAVQGNMTPGFEFNIQHTVEALRRNGLTYAYFNLSRHQRGDWFVAKNLTVDGLVVLAHEFEPAELLEEDWGTISDRWANLATEAGTRLCSVRFFRVIHAADPLESITYIRSLSQALRRAGFITGSVGALDLTVYRPERDIAALAGAGLSAAGAAGLAADLLPIPNSLKLLGVGMAAAGLTGLPLWEQSGDPPANGHAHDHPHDHDHDHHHSHHHDHDHDHEHHHHHHDDHEHDHHHDHPHDHDHDHEHHHHSYDDDAHDHEHDHHHDHDHHDHEHGHDHHHGHSHDRIWSTAYGPKGTALAATVAYPAAIAAINGAHPTAALAQAVLIGAAGATALSATTTEADYVMGVEEYRGYNLDWLVPVGLSAATVLAGQRRGLWWLPLVGVGLAAAKQLSSGFTRDPLIGLDREHRHAHTHHLSAFQRILGDSKMALSPQPLRKWSLLAPLGVVTASVLKRNGQDELAAAAVTAAAVGEVATLAGFRNSQRPLVNTVEGRAKAWTVGAALAGLVWGLSVVLNKLTR